MRYTKFETVLRPSEVYESKYDYSVTSSDATADFAVNVLEADIRPEEHFYALSVNTKGGVIGINEVSKGNICGSFADSREVFRTAIIQNAAAVVLIHNHPSGDIQPSPEDVKTTKRLCEAGEILGIKVVDHVIVGNNTVGYFSMKGNGMM